MESKLLRRIVINAGYFVIVLLSILNVGKFPCISVTLLILVEVIGIALFIASLFAAFYIHSMYPKKHDKPSDFPELLKTGPYSVVRHPFYLAVMVNQLSITLILASWLGLLAFLALLPLWFRLIEVEEQELLDYWGDEYRRYMREVPRLFPRF